VTNVRLGTMVGCCPSSRVGLHAAPFGASLFCWGWGTARDVAWTSRVLLRVQALDLRPLGHTAPAPTHRNAFHPPFGRTLPAPNASHHPWRYP